MLRKIYSRKFQKALGVNARIVILPIIVFALIVFPSLWYALFLHSEPELEVINNLTEIDEQDTSTYMTDSFETFDQATCNAQTIACNQQFQENKSLACGIAKGNAIDALLDDPACKGLERSYVEQQLNEACDKGCLTSTPTPTQGQNQPTPTTTTPPNKFTINNAKFALPGIGNGQFDNKLPVTATRKILAILYNQSGTKITQTESDFTYDNTGFFKGNLEFTAYENSTNYVTIKDSVSLSKKISTNATNILKTGDINSDNQLDIKDYNLMIACFKSSNICTDSIKKLSDLNDNGTLQGEDLNILQRSFGNDGKDLVGDF